MFFLKENNVLLDMFFLYERMFFFPSFVRNFHLNHLSPHFSFWHHQRHGVFLQVLWILLGRRTGCCHGLRGGENGKTWAAEGGLSFFLGFGFSWDFPCLPKKIYSIFGWFFKEVWSLKRTCWCPDRPIGLSRIFSKRCMVLLGFLWFGVVFFLPSFYCRDGDWDKWLSAVLLLSTATRWLSADTCLFLVLMGYGLKPSFLNLPQMDTHVKHQGLGTYQLVGRISATVLSGEWPVFQNG